MECHSVDGLESWNRIQGQDFVIYDGADTFQEETSEREKQKK